ncbi:hypothetical protein [Bradyrhizobium sp. S3.2.12]|uniref:hypothetical protein n=1 Tax=Bradyrhizobium sp. S3.2.12 TaxID=3156387 RepID=UPI003393B84E
MALPRSRSTPIQSGLRNPIDNNSSYIPPQYGSHATSTSSACQERKRNATFDSLRIVLRQLGVYPEFRETHFLSRQIQRLNDVDLVYRVGQQIFDEAKHTKVLVDQLVTWGAAPLIYWDEPIYEWSAAFDYMDKQTNPAEYFVGSNFIGEGLFLASIMAPMAKADPETCSIRRAHYAR